MFSFKGLYLVCSAILILQFSRNTKAVEADVSLSAGALEDISDDIGALQKQALSSGLDVSKLQELQQQASSLGTDASQLYKLQQASLGGSSLGGNSNYDYGYNSADDLSSEYNSYSQLIGGFANDMGEYGLNGLHKKMDFEKSLLDNTVKGAQNGAGYAKAGFGKAADIGTGVLGYGVEGLKKKIDFEKKLLSQGLKSAQNAGGTAKNLFGKTFNYGTNIGSNLFGKCASAAENAAAAAGSYGTGLGGGSWGTSGLSNSKSVGGYGKANGGGMSYGENDDQKMLEVGFGF